MSDLNSNKAAEVIEQLSKLKRLADSLSEYCELDSSDVQMIIDESSHCDGENVADVLIKYTDNTRDALTEIHRFELRIK